ncbi:hypothetical protein JAAARDRAFT_61552 [Jaapia argillacea MUCL 33604]|uniref:Trafficking protein particle complex subunit 6B n=1 Tax=Jaapia argillacea MUCL 33604 TaxID=933084 RepID=A0A067PRL9_9AGAM|nr:hypothetical protein JAAARDRAFT_61552 [Jaapia argillacea MUCL 33604]
MNPRPSTSTPIPMANLNALSEGSPRLIDGAALDYLTIELVNTLRASSALATARIKAVEQELLDAGLTISQSPSGPPLPSKKEKGDLAGHRDSTTSLVSLKGSKLGLDEEDEPLRLRLEAIGMHVGANICERLCRDRGLFTDTLDMIKFICKDLWATCWDKQVDNLRTNHRGVYVLQDNSFKPIARISSWEGRPESIRRARLYAILPAGIIRGALARLGLNATVTPEITTLPQCTFQVKLPKGA